MALIDLTTEQREWAMLKYGELSFFQISKQLNVAYGNILAMFREKGLVRIKRIPSCRKVLDFKECRHFIYSPDYEKSGIYKFTNLVNEKVYVGQAVNIYKRYSAHCTSKMDRPLYRAFRKYGLNSFSFEIIEFVDNVNCLTEREQHWLNHFQSFNPDKGYNQSPTAESVRGRKRRPEEYANGIAALKRMTEEGVHPWKGRHHSENTKLKLSLQRKGKPVSEATLAAKIKAKSKPIQQICLSTGTIVKTWDSCTQAADVLKISRTILYYAVKGGYTKPDGETLCEDGIYKGFKWQPVRPDTAKRSTPRSNGKIPNKVVQIDPKTGEILNLWPSTNEAAQTLNLRRKAISRVCSGERSGQKYADCLWQYLHT